LEEAVYADEQVQVLTPELWNWTERGGRLEPRNWGAGKRSRVTVARGPTGNVVLTAEGDPDGYFWFMARSRALRSHLSVREPGLYTLRVGVETRGEVAVAVRLTVYDNAEMAGTPLEQWRTRPRDGVAHFAFTHGGGERFLRLEFRVDGRGEVELGPVERGARPLRAATPVPASRPVALDSRAGGD
jgi:hypothetical protein